MLPSLKETEVECAPETVFEGNLAQTYTHTHTYMNTAKFSPGSHEMRTFLGPRPGNFCENLTRRNSSDFSEFWESAKKGRKISLKTENNV